MHSIIRRISNKVLIPRTQEWRQCVSTWSHLAQSFNSRPSRQRSFVSQQSIGLFGITELQSPDGFHVMKEQAMSDTNRLVKEACDPGRSRKMVEVLDELSDSLCRVADLAEFIRLGHPDASYSQAAEDACISVNSIVENLNTNQDLYRVLQNVSENGEKFPTTDVDKHVAQLFLFDFEQCGIHLGEAERRKVVQLNDFILQAGQRFMAGASNPRAIPKSTLPTHIRHLFYSEGDCALVTGPYTSSPNSEAREFAYCSFLSPDEHQHKLLSNLLTARLQLAQICGFPSYAHRAVESSTVSDPGKVMDFLNILTDNIKPSVEKDYNSLRQMKEEEVGSPTDIYPWDTQYYTQKARINWLRHASEDFSQFFSLGGCMEGLNELVNILYGINLNVVEVKPGECWSPDVYKIEVVHESEGVLGHIYCDFYERPGKPNQDCHFTIRSGRMLPDGSYQNPIVVLMLNFPAPQWSTPSLLTPGMLDHLFHEMGHALHSMMARTQYQHVSGTRCATDFAEVPSVIMEYFASDPRILGLFARHHQSRDRMPTHMLHRLCASKHLYAASEMQLQIFLSALDQHYHGTEPLGPTGCTTDVLAHVQKKYHGLSYVPNTAWQLRFSHLVGYGAKYYSYLVSRAISCWIWHRCFQPNPLSRTQGERFRRECLAHGGGKPPDLVLSDFLHKQVTPSQLASSLLHDLDYGNEQINNVN